MKKLFAFVSVIMLALTLAACSTDGTEDTYLTVDINPTVEFIVNEDGTVESYNAMNEDAEIVLADLDLEGMNYEAALELYLEEATELGFIDVDAENNAVYVATSEEDTDDEDSLNVRAQEKINEHFESRGILGAAVKKDLEEEYGDIAEEYDIGLGKARLIARAVELNDDLTMEEAVEMDMSEIMAMLREDHQERMEEFRTQREEEAKAMKQAMKDQVRQKVEDHRSEWADKMGGNGQRSMDTDQLKQNIHDHMEQNRTDFQQRIDDLKEDARAQMEPSS